MDCVKTFPFSAKRRLVVVKDCERISEEDTARLIDYMKRPSNTAYLVLRTKDETFLKENPEVGRYVTVRRFGAFSDYELKGWIRQFFSLRSKSIDEEALTSLKELYGQSISLLVQELEKLVTSVGSRPDIRMADVEELSVRIVAKSAFDLTYFIGRKSLDDALSLIHDLMLRGKKTFEIIGLLSWHMNRLLRAKRLQEKGESDSSILNVLRVSRLQAREFLRQAGFFSTAQIESKLKTLLEADIDIKRSKFDPRLVLEFACLRLCL